MQMLRKVLHAKQTTQYDLQCQNKLVAQCKNLLHQTTVRELDYNKNNLMGKWDSHKNLNYQQALQHTRQRYDQLQCFQQTWMWNSYDSEMYLVTTVKQLSHTLGWFHCYLHLLQCMWRWKHRMVLSGSVSTWLYSIDRSLCDHPNIPRYSSSTQLYSVLAQTDSTYTTVLSWRTNTTWICKSCTVSIY